MELTGNSALGRQVAVTVLVQGIFNSMKLFNEKQAENSALGRGVAVMDFIEDMVTSWIVAYLDEADVTILETLVSFHMLDVMCIHR